MRRLIFVFALASMFLNTAAAQTASEEIEFFHGTWKEALAESKTTGKPIFMDAYTSWCGPCKWMAANTFKDESVAAFFNENFVNVKMDMEKGEGPVLGEKYQVMAYPTLLFINKKGKVIRKELGAKAAKDFLKIGQAVAKKVKA